MNHLDKRISALVDGELGHEARDRALAHVAHCPSCRERLGAERALKERVATSPSPAPPGRLVRSLLAIAPGPGESGPARRRTPVQPMVPSLATRPSTWLRAPRGRTDARAPGSVSSRAARRGRYAAAGALSVGALVLGTAFAAGGSTPGGGVPVVPPAAELSVEHAATSAGLPLRVEAFDAVTASLGGLSFPAAPAAPADR
jgi:anti-sigma factor RsiW